ncbi:hypothetical protein U9M48_009445, partial [Paspalum notatum var. saurae]
KKKSKKTRQRYPTPPPLVSCCLRDATQTAPSPPPPPPLDKARSRAICHRAPAIPARVGGLLQAPIGSPPARSPPIARPRREGAAACTAGKPKIRCPCKM